MLNAYARSFVKGGGGGLKFLRGGGGKKIRNRAAAVTGPQRHLAALGLGDSSLYNSPHHAAGKSFEINQLANHSQSVLIKLIYHVLYFYTFKYINVAFCTLKLFCTYKLFLLLFSRNFMNS